MSPTHTQARTQSTHAGAPAGERGAVRETPCAAELVLRDVGFSYDRGLPAEKAVLRSVSLGLRGGEFISVVGRTGSGKTTLGLIAAGLVKPHCGEVRLTPPDSLDQGRLDVVMVFQVPESQFFEEDVFSEVAFGPSRLGLRGALLDARVRSSLERLDLDPASVSHRSPVRLSEAEKRSVAIASALACEPRFLILDEPTISLDWVASARLFRLLRGLVDSGVSALVLTHEVEKAVAESDAVAVLAEGRLSTPRKLTAEDVYAAWQGRDGAGTALG